MSLTQRTLLELAGSKQVFERGLQIYNAGHVNMTTAKSIWKNQITIKASAFDDKETPKYITMEYNSGRILSSRCSCMSKEFQHHGYLCQHAIAAALAWMDLLDNNRKDSDPQVLNMIADYQKIRINDVIAEYTLNTEEDFDPISLQPVLSFYEGRLAVSFRIGRSRFYKVHNIAELVATYRSGEKYLYGKFLEFYHIPEAFDTDSVRMLDTLQTIVDHLSEEANPKDTSQTRLSKDQSMLLPGSADFDLLFDSFTDSLVEADGILSKSGCLKICNENFALKVRLSARNANRPQAGMNLLLLDKMLCFAGKKHDYIIYKDYLYRTSEDYHRYMGPFIKEVSTNLEDQEPRIRICGKDMPAFIRNVLPTLRKYAKLECDESIIESYTEGELRAEFIMDMPQEMEITLDIRLHYGDKVYNPLDEDKPDVSRDLAKEKEIALFASQYFHRKYLDRKLLTTYQDEEATLKLLTGGIMKFALLGEVKLSKNLEELKIRRPQSLSINANPVEDWLTLDVNLDGMNPEELMEILNHYQEKQNYYRLKDGSLVILKNGQMETLTELMEGLAVSGKQLAEGGLKISKNRAFYIRKMADRFSSARVNEWLIAMTDRLLDPDLLADKAEVPEPLQGVLRHYQTEGYQWMAKLDEMGFGGILADDMGLGKTLQAIALFSHIYGSKPDSSKPKEARPSLIVCPSSLVYNWKKEIERFAPWLSVSLIIGNGKERKELLRSKPESEIWITSYDLLRRDVDSYKEYEFRVQILDEAQYIKNQSTLNARAVKKINSLRRFALTGTPVENRLGELWSIFDYLMPGFLYSYNRFRTLFETPISKEHNEASLNRLLLMISPFILRRMKKDVLTELPDKNEIQISPAMSGEQKKLYTALALKLKKKLAHETDESFNRSRTTILSDLTRLREICCAPSLVYDNFKGENAKLEALLELVNSCIEGGHRMLIFSQFARMIYMIGERLEAEGIPCLTLTGQTSKLERDAMVEQFAAEDIPVFLISLKAGGTGLNLTQADTVIHYDPWWNVAAQNQATDRAHRIGQTKEVNVYRLICADSIEENILKLQNAKQNLVDQVLSGSNTGLAGLSREELMELL